MSFPTDFLILQQNDLLMDGFKDSIAKQVMVATNVTAQQVAVAQVRPGSAIADVYVSAPSVSTDDLEMKMENIGALFDNQFKSTFQVDAASPISVGYASTTTNTPGEDAAAAAAVASHQVANKAGTIVGIEIAVIGLVAIVVGVFAVRYQRRRAAAALALERQQRNAALEVQNSIL
jgi:hypothetical protein